MARAKKHEEHVNHERWLISYADFITLLFAFFVVMFAVSKVDAKKVGRFQDSFLLATGVPGNAEHGYLPRPEDMADPLSASMPVIVKVKDPTAPAGEAAIYPKELADLERVLEEQKAMDKDLAGLKIIRRGNDLVLRLDATFLFDAGDDKVKPASMPALMAIADQVRDRDVQLRVEGHTDSTPIRTMRFRSNWDLSTARATSVVDELTMKAKIDSKRIAAMGYAEFQPLADNDSNENRAKNRRVDIVLSMPMVLPAEHAQPQPPALQSIDPSLPAQPPQPAPNAAPSPSPSPAPSQPPHP